MKWRRTAKRVTRVWREPYRDLAKGLTVSNLCLGIGITETTYYTGGVRDMTRSKLMRIADVGNRNSRLSISKSSSTSCS
jgi:hypothetical protein